MATIYIDNRPYDVKDGQNLLQACLGLGFNVPYFCWHPALQAVGACRQCAVKQFRDEQDTRGRIVMSCMTPASNNTRISIDDPEVRAFRAANIEWLMLNHPHDCPVCDEGGECHLQDMTVLTGHVYRRTRFPKRTQNNQYLGPLVNHELNRCIQCYRCTRFYQDFAGGDDLGVFGAHDRLYFGRAEDGVLESEFAGNLVEVCPTGVFTDKTRRFHYTRKWDLSVAPSICVNCSLGCNTQPGERYGMLRQIRNRYNGEVNGYFVCDRGRYGYEFVNSERRIREPVGAGGAALTDESYGAIMNQIVDAVRAGRAVGIGSPRASLEANFALATLVGRDSFFAGVSSRERDLVDLAIDILRAGPVRTPSLREIERMDAVLILGEDPTNNAPMLALALRQLARRQPMKQLLPKARIPEWDDAAVRGMIQNRHGPFYVATPAATKLDDLASRAYRGGPTEIARLGQAVARALGVPGAPVPNLTDDLAALASEIALALKSADRPLVVVGTGLGRAEAIRAAADVANALAAMGKPAGLFITQSEVNSIGIGLLGGEGLDGALRAVREGRADTVIIVENDLYRRAPTDVVDALFAQAKHVVAIDHVANATTARAGITLPAATFAESDGTFVNNEGRAQRFFQAFVPAGSVQASWRWLRDIAVAAERLLTGAWPDLDSVIAALVAEHPSLAPVAEIAPSADFRISGLKVARQTRRFSGRTAMLANVSVSEPKPPEDPDAPFNFSMEGFQGQPPSALVTQYWSPGWNSVQSLNKFQEEIAGPLRGGDPGRRLLNPPTPTPESTVRYFGEASTIAETPDGRLVAVPLYHIFGSEELSILTPGITELAPAPYLGLSPADAERLGLAAESTVEVTLGGLARRLAVRIIPSLAVGLVGVPVGLPGLVGLELPALVDLGDAASGRSA